MKSNSPMLGNTRFFTAFDRQPESAELPALFILMLNNTPHPLCALAVRELQHYLHSQQEWQHNFGLDEKMNGNVIGKMFGVLVVQSPSGDVGYLCAFSGKLAGSNTHSKFVPPVFDTLAEDGFLAPGMEEVARMTAAIKNQQSEQADGYETRINQLQRERKNYSRTLQRQLFANYFCSNQNGVQKSVYDIFAAAGYKNPPAGAAECATPKLLQYAFQHQLKPLAIAEFWWGQSPKSTHWKHGEFYACCKEKCEPILSHMLSGLEHEYV